MQVKSLAVVPGEDKKDSSWRIQIFRSIPTDAAMFDENKKAYLNAKVAGL